MKFKVGDLVRRKSAYVGSKKDDGYGILKGDLGVITSVNDKQVVIRYFKGAILDTSLNLVNSRLEKVEDNGEG